MIKYYQYTKHHISVVVAEPTSTAPLMPLGPRTLPIRQVLQQQRCEAQQLRLHLRFDEAPLCRGGR